MSGIIRIARNYTSIGSLVGTARDLEVYIDGERCGVVKWNSFEDFHAEPGQRIVWVKMDWCRSRDLAVDVSAGERATFECHAPGISVSWLGIMTRVFGYSNDFFELRRKY